MRVARHISRSSVPSMLSDPLAPLPSTKRVDPRQTLGRLGEELAAAHLERLGFSMLGRNERTRYGEIDLIAFDARTLVFAEVKTRRVSAHAKRVRPDQEPLTWLRRP